MKTTKNLKHLNFNDLAFFLGITPVEAKWKIGKVIYGAKDIPTTAKGAPKITSSDQVEVDQIDFTIRSNSELDGGCQFTYLVEYYNKGITIDALRNFGENKTFIKKLKFTNKFAILNEIMNDEQYLKLQKIWLFSNVYGKTKISNEASDFVYKHDWAEKFLESKGIKRN